MTVTQTTGAVDVAAIDATLGDFFACRRGEAEAFGPDFAATVAELESFVLRGGKRVRPAFVWLGWLGAGGDPGGPRAHAVLRAGAAFELLHAAGLIHDDIIDASLTRRGHPSAHVAFAERHRARRFSGDPAAFGVGTAIVIGDLALIWADALLGDSGLPTDAQTRVAPVWSAVRAEVMYGQLLDLINQAGDNEDVESALRVDRYKTASYTVQRPLQFGGAVAGADPALTTAYGSYGTDIGIAFQLRDDLLGVFGDPTVTGKPSGDDLREGKRTVLLATALTLADAHDAASADYLRTKIGTDLTADELDRVRTILVDVGAVARIETQISMRGERALAVLDASDATDLAKRHLAELAVTVLQRSR
ncbi:polyprenyl synthetase family protein [Micromonospora sp. HUAS LYJ1]|uniref:polyprenyl synthetase family protein n=1 Tax=Micromonospora sp. HUAS LYJ1 TaxID=3061626 RepID=UPI00267287EB|nr:polyprenyl synthetase family protein [Micromonospora sp. HUAS LYJ1]WKU07087.1 polyprenyl synthetase family protein [Micromonospora sp. HUAS LYJ1]